MEAPEEITKKITKELLGALPEEAEDDFQRWLADPSDEGLTELLEKYNIDAEKIAREMVLKEENE